MISVIARIPHQQAIATCVVASNDVHSILYSDQLVLFIGHDMAHMVEHFELESFENCV